MVTFLSLFLWLMTDVHPVKVAVDPGVTSVEIFLDGESIGVVHEPDWEVKCDFGKNLRPHELVAVARDEAGRELGRAVQLVNLPRADAEVEIVFEGESREAPTALRVITESAERPWCGRAGGCGGTPGRPGLYGEGPRGVACLEEYRARD